MPHDTISIPLSKTGKHAGKFEAIVDAIDSDLEQLHWVVDNQYRNSTQYAQYAHRTENKNGKRYLVKMHRVILARKLERESLLPTEYVDHADGNGLNNTRDNLRLATNAQNQANRRKNRDNTSGYKGVGKMGKKWYAKVNVNKKRVYLGVFITPELANEACIKAREKYHGEFAKHGNNED